MPAARLRPPITLTNIVISANKSRPPPFARAVQAVRDTRKLNPLVLIEVDDALHGFAPILPNRSLADRHGNCLTTCDNRRSDIPGANAPMSVRVSQRVGVVRPRIQSPKRQLAQASLTGIRRATCSQ
jgi:hypothetical protein